MGRARKALVRVWQPAPGVFSHSLDPIRTSTVSDREYPSRGSERARSPSRIALRTPRPSNQNADSTSVFNIERGLRRYWHFRCRPRRPLKVRWRRRLLLEAIVIPASSPAGTAFRERCHGKRQPKDGPQKRPRCI